MSKIASGKPDNDETARRFLDGSRRSYALLRSASIGLGVYQPGWRWSVHAMPQTGRPSANHIGYVISGSLRVLDPGGEEREIGPGTAFEIGPGSDAWVSGDAPCTALDFIPYAGPGEDGANDEGGA